MSIPAVSGVSGVTPAGLLDGLEAAGRTGGSESVFAGALSGAMEDLATRQASAADLSVKALTGELENVHEYTIAATEAQVALELTVALRNKAVEAFTEIMRMQA